MLGGSAVMLHTTMFKRLCPVCGYETEPGINLHLHRAASSMGDIWFRVYEYDGNGRSGGQGNGPMPQMFHHGFHWSNGDCAEGHK